MIFHKKLFIKMQDDAYRIIKSSVFRLKVKKGDEHVNW